VTKLLTLFKEKNSGGDHYSMTRGVAFMFTIVYLVTLWTYATKAIPINWAFATLGCVVLLAIPIQAIFAYLQQWISSQPGQDLLTTAIHKVEESLMPGAPTQPAPQPTVNVSATVSPGEKG
jgi:hypothetical protein